MIHRVKLKLKSDPTNAKGISQAAGKQKPHMCADIDFLYKSNRLEIGLFCFLRMFGQAIDDYELGTLRGKDVVSGWSSSVLHRILHRIGTSVDVVWAALGSKSHGAGISR